MDKQLKVLPASAAERAMDVVANFDTERSEAYIIGFVQAFTDSFYKDSHAYIPHQPYVRGTSDADAWQAGFTHGSAYTNRLTLVAI